MVSMEDGSHIVKHMSEEEEEDISAAATKPDAAIVLISVVLQDAQATIIEVCQLLFSCCERGCPHSIHHIRWSFLNYSVAVLIL